MTALFWVLLNRSVTGYEVRAVGFNPDAAEYGGISAGRNYVKVMLSAGCSPASRGRSTCSGGSSASRRTTSSSRQVGYYGIAVALLGRNTAFGTVVAALLFGALLNGTSVRNLDPGVFDPQLAGNLTWIIQGLIVLFVSAPVLVTYLAPGRAGAAAAAPKAAGARGGADEHDLGRTGEVPAGAGGRRLAPARAAGARVARAWFGWGGVALGLIAFYITLPPLLVRSILPVARDRRGGSGSASSRCAPARSASAGARSWPAWPARSAPTARSSRATANLERVVVWSALLAARCATRRR